MISRLIVFAIIFAASSAHAIIPTSKTILSRTASQHGKGAYVVEQDVTIKAEGEPIVVREKWTILNAETMAVDISRKSGPDIKLDLVYRGSKRTFVDPQGAVKTLNTSSEFIEPYFYFRTSGSLQTALERAKVLPSDFGQVPRKIVSMNPKDKSESAALMSVPEPYVRLSRTGGVVAYELGKVTDNPAGNPGAWIEQDAFTIRKIKFPSLAEVQADQYQAFANQLRFPRERTIKWGTHTATARVISVRPISTAEATANLKLSGGEEAASKVPDIAGLKEFYSRFR